MIELSEDFDLGNDRTRIKDSRDAQRQSRTAQELLRRMFHADPARRWELQLVADEVGMGKTFVALAVAYSLLHAMGSEHNEPDIRGCARRVLVIAPQNASLSQKWRREVQEFLRRCVPDEQIRDEAREWFMGASDEAVRPAVGPAAREVRFVERLDELAQALRSDEPGVVVTHMGVLAGGKKLLHYDIKRRLLLGALFRFWGPRFQNDARARLLKGSPDEWPRYADELTRLTSEEWEKVPFDSDEEVVTALRALGDSDGEVRATLDELLSTCREIAAPYVRDRAEKFAAVEGLLNRLYRHVCFALVRKAIPLVIVDEAHNWKNGPTGGANGYAGFRQFVAPHTRRVLLLTATPFQLRPQEMLELLKVGSIIAPCSARSDAQERRARLESHRESVLRPVLESAARQSRAFAAAWARLPWHENAALAAAWDDLSGPRVVLRRIAHAEGAVDQGDVERIVDGAVGQYHPDLREILREGLRLYAYNEDLSQELGELVIRHRRRTDHRLIRVGAEYADPSDAVSSRPDRHLLHVAPGLDVDGPAELPHYLLMRCVTEMKRGKGRSSLGSALTGCYSTLIGSAEGKALRSALVGGRGATYLNLLTGMVTEAHDVTHPKVRAVVDAVISAWRAGEKSLVFCFRTNTARRLHQILNDRITAELDTRRAAVLGSDAALGRLRSRFTRRDGDLMPLGLDRVLWSLLWAARSGDQGLPDLDNQTLKVTDDELTEIARLGLRHGVDLRDDPVDRVFLHRAIEHVIARRLLRERVGDGPLFRKVLEAMATPAWVERPYGVTLASAVDDREGEQSREMAGVDDRGVHAVYAVREESPHDAPVTALADGLRERRERARAQGQISIIDAYAEAPSFWLGKSPDRALGGDPGAREHLALARLHEHLLKVTRSGREIDWRERLYVFQALRRAILRESVLVRILPERSELDEQGWGDLLVERYFAPLPGQQESTADRLAVFVEDLQAADGSVLVPGKPRHTIYEATRMRDQSGFAVLVDGSTDPDRRERVFAGFNSPLLPEVLICTSVGQEGIDLHRHCRHVIHYDLAWNPAVLEQRTGRVDRIGSKTFREREIERSFGNKGPFLEVGVPFLAGTYDERMYEEIRIRAQTFEVLTGGDVAADNLEGADDIEGAEGSEAGFAFPVLPRGVIEDLRVRLHVWEASDESSVSTAAAATAGE